MRAVILAILFVAHASEAGVAVPGAKLFFEMSVKGHYSARITRIFKNGRTWFCETELTPYHEASRAPVDFAVLDRLRKQVGDRKIAENCRDRAVVVDHRNGKASSFAICLDDEAAMKSFVSHIDKNCGR